jgi:drug/metabolite transporter (DMT)-like permease
MSGILSLLSSIPMSYVFALISGFSWALAQIIIKNYLFKSFDIMDIFVLRMGLGFPLSIIILCIVISFVSFKKVSLQNNYFTSLVKKTRQNYTHKYMIAFTLSIIAGLVGLYSFWRVLSINHGSYSVAFVWPLVVLFTTLISYFFYNEKITQTQGIGIVIIMIGLVLINIKGSIVS